MSRPFVATPERTTVFVLRGARVTVAICWLFGVPDELSDRVTVVCRDWLEKFAKVSTGAESTAGSTEVAPTGTPT